MSVLICGSRYYKDYEKIYKYIKEELHPNVSIIHGNCFGADKLADRAAKALNRTIRKYDADWGGQGNAAGPIRNKKMLDDNKDIILVVAFHEDFNNSKGTKNMIAQTKKRNIPYILYT